MKRLTIITAVALACFMPDLTVAGGVTADARGGGTEASTLGADPTAAPTSAELDQLLAPIALYPDQLLAQILLCAGDPAGLTALNQFIKSHPTLKGSDLQDAVLKDNFEASFVALALFPQTVALMAGQLDKTAEIGRAFAADKTAVFASIQRLRAQARNAGNLKTTPQQEVETKTTSSGEQVIVIEPANPQVVYVPTYNPQTVYVQSAPTTTVVVQEQSNDAAIAAGVIGFTAGIAIGAAVNNNYYYGPYGWRGGAYMYNDAWDDYYDHREDAREDWMDHREDMAENRGDRAQNAQEQRSERRENTGEQRTDRQQNRQENGPDSQAQRSQRSTQSQAASTSATRSPAGTSYESRGHSQSGNRATTQAQTGTRSDAFSGYSSGRSERAASSRGQSSRSSSRGSRGGGGRRR